MNHAFYSPNIEPPVAALALGDLAAFFARLELVHFFFLSSWVLLFRPQYAILLPLLRVRPCMRHMALTSHAAESLPTHLDLHLFLAADLGDLWALGDLGDLWALTVFALGDLRALGTLDRLVLVPLTFLPLESMRLHSI